MVMSDEDPTCPGLWVELGDDIGYCDLGDECHNPVRSAHERQITDAVAEPDDDA